MYHFDLRTEPPTTQELTSILAELKELRRKLVVRSCISDGVHALILLLLYIGDFLSGRSILVLVALSLVVAILLATATRDRLIFSDLLAIAATTVTTATAIVLILGVGMSQPWPASFVAGLIAGSVVISGTVLGRSLKSVIFAIEQIKPVAVDDPAYQELGLLCQRYPELRHYREQAAGNLRPQLTYGELAAMHEWHQNHRERNISNNP